MGKRLEQTFFQRYTNGQQVHGKVLHFTNFQGNAKQTTGRDITRQLLGGPVSRTKKQCVVEHVKKLNPFCTVGGNAKWGSYYEKTT